MEEIKIKKLNNNELPKYETEGSAGLDLRASLEEDITLKPFEIKSLKVGISIALPKGYEAQIRPRSGFSFKHKIILLNSPGTIDSDYRGEISVLLLNLSNKPFCIKNGDRVAQMVINKCEQVSFKVVQKLDDTERGNGGFGHTGIK